MPLWRCCTPGPAERIALWVASPAGDWCHWCIEQRMKGVLQSTSGAVEGPLPHQKGPRGPEWAPPGSVDGLPHPLLGKALADSRHSIMSSAPPQTRVAPST